MTDRIAIGDEVQALCDKFGIRRELTEHIDIRPSQVVVSVFLTTEKGGGIRILPSGDAARETKTFEVTT